MFKQAETILNILFLLLIVLFFIFISARLRAIFFKKKSRTPVWKKQNVDLYTITGILKAFSLLLMGAGIIYFLFVILIFTAVLHTLIKTLFIVMLSTWILLEFLLSFSIPDDLGETSVFKQIAHFSCAAICVAGALLLVPKIVQSYPFPEPSMCVIIDPPVRGMWLAGHAGATIMTNSHSKNRYAIDCLKIGPDGRFFRGGGSKVTDSYSYNEPVYAPAAGRITEVVENLESDLMGKSDRTNPGGNYVIMDLGDGKYFYVAHLMKNTISVKLGQEVKKGTILGYIGNSGNSSFPHLHVHVQNKPTANSEGRITYPFRFKKIRRKRLIFWQQIRNAPLIRNDRFCYD